MYHNTADVANGPHWEGDGDRNNNRRNSWLCRKTVPVVMKWQQTIF